MRRFVRAMLGIRTYEVTLTPTRSDRPPMIVRGLAEKHVAAFIDKMLDQPERWKSAHIKEL